MDERPKTRATSPGRSDPPPPPGEAVAGGEPHSAAGDVPLVGGGSPAAGSGGPGRGPEPQGVEGPGPGRADLERAASIVESLLLVSVRPLTFEKIGLIAGGLSRQEVRNVVELLKAKHDPATSGIHIEVIAGGIQLRTNPANQEHVRKLFETKPPRFTRPALETLAVIAYKQPVTRSEIEQIRGVDCAAALRTVMERRLVKVVGKKDVAGRPFLFGTTREFLEVFSLSSLSDLPSMRELEEFLAARAGAVAAEAPSRAALFRGPAPVAGEASELAAELAESEDGAPLVIPSPAIPAGISDDALVEGASLAEAGEIDSLTEEKGTPGRVQEVVAGRQAGKGRAGGKDRFTGRDEVGTGDADDHASPLVAGPGGFHEGVADEESDDPSAPGNSSGNDED